MSSARQGHSAAEIVQRTTFGHNTNAQNGVTGILLNYNDNILQVLEGAFADVEETLDRLRADVRHRGMLILQDETVDDRQFPDSRTALLADGHHGTTSVPDLFEQGTNGWALKFDAEIEPNLAVLLKTFLSVNSGQNVYALHRERG